ncbi:MAG: hypothetical protein JJ714_11465 [Acidithiobacillus sp.]|nr:hypothetical protein [Acidithiobacillus sp.]
MNKEQAKIIIDDVFASLNSGEIHPEDLIGLISDETRQALCRLLMNVEDTPRVLVWLEGGLVQSVSGNQKAIDLGVDVVVADYDVEGTTDTICQDAHGDSLLIVRHDLDPLQEVGMDIIRQSLLPKEEDVS